jgi:hypothetical protein
VQQDRTSQDRFSRLIELLKAEADAPQAEQSVRQATPTYRYPRSRWSAPATQ